MDSARPAPRTMASKSILLAASSETRVTESEQRSARRLVGPPDRNMPNGP